MRRFSHKLSEVFRDLAFVLFYFLSGCAATPITEKQRLVLQNRLYPNTNISEVRSLFKNVLLERKYSIKTDEPDLIIASHQLSESSSSGAQREELVVSFIKHPKGVRTQVSIQKLTHYSLGGTYGEEIIAAKPYDVFYGAVLKARDPARVPASQRFGK
jgi:hypothetical protein